MDSRVDYSFQCSRGKNKVCLWYPMQAVALADISLLLWVGGTKSWSSVVRRGVDLRGATYDTSHPDSGRRPLQRRLTASLASCKLTSYPIHSGHFFSQYRFFCKLNWLDTCIKTQKSDLSRFVFLRKKEYSHVLRLLFPQTDDPFIIICYVLHKCTDRREYCQHHPKPVLSFPVFLMNGPI